MSTWLNFLQKGMTCIHALLESCYQLQKSRNYPILLRYLCDVDFWEAKARYSLLASLLKDLQRALEDPVDSFPDDFYCHIAGNKVTTDELRILMSALYLEIAFLEKYPQYTAKHIYNRCCRHDNSTSGIFRLMQHWLQKSICGGWIEAKTTMYPDLGSSCVQVLEGHEGDVYGLSLSWDGRYILSGAVDSTAKLWDLATGQCIQNFLESGRVYDVSLSQDQKYAVVCNSWGEVNLWSLKKQKKVQQRKVHKGEVYSLAICDDIVASAGEDGKICLWKIPSLKRVATLQLHEQVISAIAMNHQYVVSGGKSGWCVVWDRENQSILYKWRHEAPIRCIAIDNSNKFVAVGSYDGNIYLWDLTCGAKLTTLRRHKDYVTAVMFSKDSQQLFSTSKSLLVWDLKSYRCIKTFSGHNGFVWSAQLTDDNRFVITGAYDETIRIWDTHKVHNLRKSPNHTGRIYDFLVRNNGEVVTTSRDRTVKFWNIEKASCTRTVRNKSVVLCMCVDPNTQKIVYGDAYGQIHTFGKKQHRYKLQREAITQLSFSPDGKYFASGDSKKEIKTYNSKTRKIRHTLQGHKAKITAIVCGKDFLLSADSSDTVILWEMEKGKRQKIWEKISVSFFTHTACQKLVSGNFHRNEYYVWEPTPRKISSKCYAQMMHYEFYFQYRNNEISVFNFQDRCIGILPITVDKIQFAQNRFIVATNISGHVYLFEIHPFPSIPTHL